MESSDSHDHRSTARVDKHRFFIALLPPPPIQNAVIEIQQHVAEHYASRAALRSPPHITLQPPFEWCADDVLFLEAHLQQFSATQSALPAITLDAFAAFPPRVIYINVLKLPELLTLQANLIGYCETQLGIVDSISKNRPFTPHMTVAFRDLSRQNFKAAWQTFQQRSLHFEFPVSHLTLLRHNGKQWQIHKEFLLASES
jgi:2'-5' RNA ligase